jgi:xylan 1,4-beta-xylosidase
MSQAPASAYRNSPAYGAYEVAMMKRSLDLAAEEGVNLRGVLTWAFTFPDTAYFAGLPRACDERHPPARAECLQATR